MVKPAEQEKQESPWDRAFEEVERARERHSTPDTSHFADLMKPVGGSK